MRRSIPSLLLISAALALSACGEYSTTSPLPSASNTGLAPSFAGYTVSSDDPNAAAATLAPTPGLVTFSPTGGSIDFGGLFTLTYRQFSVSLCNADGSGCTPLTHDIQVNASFGVQNGAPFLNVGEYNGQHLHFATPGARLSTSFYAGKGKQNLSITYVPTAGESVPNAQQTHSDAAGNLWRWITQFTGYTVSSCDPSDPNYDPNACQQ